MSEPRGPDWEEPIPFNEFDLPPFPTSALPVRIREWVEEEATQTQTPADLPAMNVMSTFAAAVAKTVIVVVRPGWFEPVNVFTAVALDPANRKSAVVRDATAPIVAHEQEEVDRMRTEIRLAMNRQKIAEMRLEKAQKAAACAPDSRHAELERKAEGLADELDAIAVPVAPRLLTDDVTAEKLTSLMGQQGGRIAVLSPEGGILELMAGRYTRSGAPNLDVFLKGHAGDDIRVDRVGRPSEFIRDPALSIGLAVQPAVLEGLMHVPGFRGRGLLGRFWYSLPKTLLGRRVVSPPSMVGSTRDAYWRDLRCLLQLAPGSDEEGRSTPHALRLTPDALVRLDRFEAEIEPRLGEQGDLGLMPDWGGKLVGAVVRITGILHMMQHAADPRPWDSFIDIETIENAILIGRYLIPHAKAAYAAMGADPTVEHAKLILRWVDRSGRAPFSKRDAFNGLRGSFGRVDKMTEPLALLVEHHFIRLVTSSSKERRPGRPPGDRYEVNPLWATHNPHNTQNAPAQGGASAGIPKSIEPELEEGVI